MPIKPTPAQARPSVGMRAAVRRLSRSRGVTVGIVSGRSLDEVRRLVRLRGVIYVGNHGLEIRGPGVRFVHPAAARHVPAMKCIARHLEAALRDVRGALVEDKRLSLSVHWRNVPAGQVARFHRRIRAVLAPWVARRAVRVTRGKRVVEVRPPMDWNKGSAVEWLIKACRCRDGSVFYLGDDRTDEDAFRAVNRRRGVSIFVGGRRRPTAARWWLKGPREAAELFARLIEERCRTRRVR